MLEKIFKLKENNTTAKTEIIAGLTTFMTMAYIIALNPNLLTGFGKDTMPELWNGVFLATCIASAIGTIVMAFLANKPFAMAPGMGLNSFFAVVVTNIVALTGMTYVASFQSALCIVLIEGIVFLVLSVLNIREKIVDAIPLGVRLGIAPAIGLMPNLTTNLTQTECYRLSLMAPKLLTYDIIQNSIPIEGTYKDATHRKMSVLEVDFEANKKFLQENLYGTGDSTATAASEN